MDNLNFHFVDEEGEAVFPDDATWLAAFPDCLKCGFGIRFMKKYEPVPLHYQSLLRRCNDVACPRCGTVHRHGFEDGEDVFFTVESITLAPDLNQLSLFTT